MTKTLQSNKQSELDAESVPSSLRIVCDDASSINLQAAEVAGLTLSLWTWQACE